MNTMLACARRYWWLIVMSAVGGGIGAIALATHQGKTYEAQAELLVRFGWEHLYRPVATGTEGWQPARLVELLNAEVRILNSRSVREAALREVGITTVYPGSADGQDDQDDSSPVTRILQAGNLLDEDDTAARATPLDRALAQAEPALAVRALGDSATILLSFRHPDPVIARRVLAALIAAYLDQRARVFVGDEPAAAALRLEQTEARLKAAQSALWDYRAANDAVLLEERLEAALATAGSLERQALQAEALAGGRPAIADQIGGWPDWRHGPGGTVTPWGSALPEVRLDADGSGDALVEIAGAPGGEVWQAARASGTRLLAPLQGTVQAELASAPARPAAAALEPEIAHLRRLSEQVATLQQTIDVAAETRRDALERMERAQSLALFAERGLQSVVVIDAPFTPPAPLGLGLLEKLALGILIGAVLGGGIAFMAGQRSSSRQAWA